MNFKKFFFRYNYEWEHEHPTKPAVVAATVVEERVPFPFRHFRIDVRMHNSWESSR